MGGSDGSWLHRAGAGSAGRQQTAAAQQHISAAAAGRGRQHSAAAQPQQRGTAENHGTGIAKPGHSLVALNLFFFFLFQFFADTLSTGSSIRDHLPREKETGPAGPLIMPLIMPARPNT